MRVYEVLTFKSRNITSTSQAPSPFLNKRDAMFHEDLAVAARPRGHRFFWRIATCLFSDLGPCSSSIAYGEGT